MYWISETLVKRVVERFTFLNRRKFDFDGCWLTYGGAYMALFDPSECDTSEKREALINYAKASYGL